MLLAPASANDVGGDGGNKEGGASGMAAVKAAFKGFSSWLGQQSTCPSPSDIKAASCCARRGFTHSRRWTRCGSATTRRRHRRHLPFGSPVVNLCGRHRHQMEGKAWRPLLVFVPLPPPTGQQQPFVSFTFSATTPPTLPTTSPFNTTCQHDGKTAKRGVRNAFAVSTATVALLPPNEGFFFLRSRRAAALRGKAVGLSSPPQWPLLPAGGVDRPLLTAIIEDTTRNPLRSPSPRATTTTTTTTCRLGSAHHPPPARFLR